MESRLLFEQSDLALVVQPSSQDESSTDALVSWANEQTDWIRQTLLEHGAILFRGFSIDSPSEFERFCSSGGGSLMRYIGGNTPRKSVAGDIYTSTEYPKHLEIRQHSEMSYASVWPERIFFFCEDPPDEGGETPIASSKSILEALAPEIRDRFAEKGVLYISNLHGGWGLGKSWMEVFETTDRSEVEKHCRDGNVEFEWNDKGSLRTKAIRPGVIRHPKTGDEVWFNQADQWHVSSLDPAKVQGLLKIMAEEELPRCVRYGDGSSIETNELDAFREVASREQITFPWQKGDVLALENVLVTHGRRPFKGTRRILVAMA